MWYAIAAAVRKMYIAKRERREAKKSLKAAVAGVEIGIEIGVASSVEPDVTNVVE